MMWRLAAVWLVLTFAGASGASAQLSQWGMWGEPPERSSKGSTFSDPSFLGAPPPLKAPRELAEGGARPSISPRSPKVTAFENGMAPGSIIIDTAGRKLYYTLSTREAYVYSIAVGKQGFTWTGVEKVSRIEAWPDWIPPAEMRARKPYLPVRMTGGVNNPLGARAIYLGSTLYRIHGTNDAASIGSAASSGCFRMHNADVVHLAGLVSQATTVYVMKRLPKAAPVMPPEGSVIEAKQPAPAAPDAQAPEVPQQAPSSPDAPQEGAPGGGAQPAAAEEAPRDI